MNSQLSIDFNAHAARRLGDEAGYRCISKAEEVCPGFSERALNFIADYAGRHENFTGEDCTNAMKADGIRAHDDRAVGPAFAKAIKTGLIRVVGIVPRTKGHGSLGGRLYAKGTANA